MIRLIFILLLVAIFSISILHAEIIEIPLESLQGLYTGDAHTLAGTTRVESFQLDRTPLVIRNAWLKISGLSTIGFLGCLPELGDGPFPWPIYFSGSMLDSTTSARWYCEAVTPDTSGYFDLTIPFHTYSGATWDFLFNKRGEIKLWGGPGGYILMCWGLIPPSGYVEQVTLLIDGDFIVPTFQTTWGRIKVIYRE